MLQQLFDAERNRSYINWPFYEGSGTVTANQWNLSMDNATLNGTPTFDAEVPTFSLGSRTLNHSLLFTETVQFVELTGLNDRLITNFSISLIANLTANSPTRALILIQNTTGQNTKILQKM